MPTFAPSSLTVAFGLLGAAGLCLVVGYILQRTRSRLLAWSWLLLTVLSTYLWMRDEGHGLRMVTLVVATLYGMKAIVAVEHRRRGNNALTLRDWLAFAGVWLGMQPAEFAKRREVQTDLRQLRQVVLWFACGAATIAVAREVHACCTGSYRHLGAYVFLFGCSMIAHFGMIGLVVIVLRRMGYAVGPQFRAPWLSNNLQNFWTRRWNIGFSVMTTMAIQRPLVPVLRPAGATFVGFVASGLLHELALSVPADGGYGLPTVYFALHGIAMTAEQQFARRGTPLTGFRGRVWVYCWVLLPAPLLFHGPFLDRVIVPILQG